MDKSLSKQPLSPWETHDRNASSPYYVPSQRPAAREVTYREQSSGVDLQLDVFPTWNNASGTGPLNASPMTANTYGSLSGEDIGWTSSLNPDDIDTQTANTEGKARYQCRWNGCTYAGSFGRQTCLWRHIKAQHLDGDGFKCSHPGCDKTFGRKDKLQKHQRSCRTSLRPKLTDVISQPATNRPQISCDDGMDTTTNEQEEMGGFEASQSFASSIGPSMAQKQPPKNKGYLENGIVNSKPQNPMSPASDDYVHSNMGMDSAISTDKGSLGSLDHILNPATYYEKLEMLELDTAEICGIASSPDTENLSQSACLEVIENTGKALRHLQSEGFCGARFSVLVEDHNRFNVARVTHLSLHDIDGFVRSHTLESSSHTQRTWGSPSSLLNKIFGGRVGSHQVVDSWTQLKLLSKTLSVGLVSFSGSHACPFDVNIWGRSLGEIPVGCGYSFRSRQLACLKDFLNGPCWVLGSTQYEPDQKGLKISLTVEEFLELWGPAQFVGGSPVSAPLMRTERGFVIPLPRQNQPDQSLDEIECHWTKEVPQYVEDIDHIWLQNTSRILIGTGSITHTSMTVNPRCKSKIHQIEKHITGQLYFPGTCKDYYTMEGHDIQFVAGYSGVSVGLVFKRKRHPGTTLKGSIILRCQEDLSDIETFLKLQIGLEISACTGNARRVSLWEAIRLYHIGKYGHGFTDCGHDFADPECLRICWSRYNSQPSTSATDSDSLCGSSQTVGTNSSFLSDLNPSNHMESDSFRKFIFTSILRLRDTGIDHEGNLQACWPFSNPAMSHQIKPTKFNRWMNLLSDSRETATFAVVSPRCLGVQKGRYPLEWGLCPPSHRELKQSTCLSTRVIRRYESQRKQRFRRRQFGMPSPSPDRMPTELAQGTVIRMGERQLSVIKFWQDADNQNLIAYPIPGGQLREVATRWSSAPDFAEQINPDLKAGELVDLIVTSRDSCGENNGGQ